MPLTFEDLEAMVAAGASAQVLLQAIRPVMKEFELLKERRARRREQNRVRVTRYRALRNALPSPPLILSPPSSTDVPCGTSVSAAKTSTRKKRPLPDDWNPVILEADAGELERFKDYAKANHKLYADWDAAWRNWKTSPYRKPNGGQNGRGPIETTRERGARLAAAVRQRERELSEGLFRTPDDGRSNRGSD